ncbi:MAG: F0F1 ATP synthase subunit delta [Firmicutes bacterium HGW-Firmicutes-15]|nr:MAG: F0F1 ATP synthase subunit delta [Firmicutes bacterium HGW-Firmicutes-15]
MLNKSVARRYAEAFFSIAQEANKIDDYQAELEKVVRSIEEIEGLNKYFAHPLVPTNDKKDIANQLFASAVSPVTLNFLLLVLDKKRQTYLELIYREYEEMADESHGIKKAEIISAMAVGDEEVNALAQTLSQSTGKTIQLKLTIDPALLGGVKIRMGDKIIDASIAKKLEMLKKNLKQAKIS